MDVITGIPANCAIYENLGKLIEYKRCPLNLIKQRVGKMKFHTLAVFAAIALIYILTGSSELNAGPIERREISGDFLFKKWTTDDGLPQNTVTSIVQTQDGYIWLGTFGGLVRFDGIKFTVFDSANSPQLISSRILSLFEDSSKSLWIGTDDGKVFAYRGRGFEVLNTRDGFERGPVWGFENDDTGNVFIASDGGIEVVGPFFQDTGSSFSSRVITRGKCYGLGRDKQGAIWGRAEKEAVLIKDGKAASAGSLGVEVPENAFKWATNSSGRVYVTSKTAVGFVENYRFQELRRLDHVADPAETSLAVEGGSLWFQEPGLLTQFRDDGETVYSLNDVVAAGTRTMIMDREGNLWLGTNGEGLVRFTRKKIRLLSELIDIRDEVYYSLAEDSHGAVWVGGTSLIRVSEGGADRIERTTDGMTFPLIKSIAIDKNDRVWVGGESGMFVLSENQLVQQNTLPDENIYALFFDRSGSLWAGGSSGLWRDVNGKREHFTTAEGLAHNSVHCIRQMRDGSVWIGTRGGINVFRNGRLSDISTDLGLAGSFVREFLEDDDGTIWIGIYGGGIYRLRDGEVRNVSSANGLKDNFVSRIIAGGRERLWILGNLGVMSVSRDELNRVADGATATITGAVFDRSDGMPSAEANGGAQTAGIVSKKGELWFPMTRDVVIIDPEKYQRHPKEVVIERAFSRPEMARVDQKASLSPVPDVIHLGNGKRNIEIEYTVLSFLNPEKTRFFIKMEGLEDGWTDVGTRRTASYPYLPAGDFVFLVKAVAPDGYVSESPAMLKISVDAYYWETWWFKTLAIIAIIVLIIYVFRIRTGQLKARQTQQEAFSKSLINAHESERERIAKELHDGLGQNLLLIKNLARAGMAPDILSDEQRSNLGQISAVTAETINETREMIGNLSPRNLRRFGLTASVKNMIVQVERATGIKFETDIDEVDNEFPPEIQLTIFRILQEGLNNLIKHSESPRGRVIISKMHNVVSLEISDVGRGFDVEETLDPTGQNSGSGLQNMVQRVRLSGGEIDIDSAAGEGTRIRLRFRRS